MEGVGGGGVWRVLGVVWRVLGWCMEVIGKYGGYGAFFVRFSSLSTLFFVRFFFLCFCPLLVFVFVVMLSPQQNIKKTDLKKLNLSQSLQHQHM